MRRSVRAAGEILDRVATPRAILVVGWSLFLVYAFPGYMSYDSVWQLEQARHIEPLNEWHPPLMALLWRFTDAIVTGPFPMLVIQSTAFLLGVRAVVGQVMSERAAAIVAVAVLLAPPNLVAMGVVWKDCQMAGFLFASIGALLSPRRGWRIAGYGLLVLATGVRYNAAAATLMVMLGMFTWHRTSSGRPGLAALPALPGWKRAVLATAAWLGVVIAAIAINAPLVEKHTYPWHTGSAPVDIVGTLHFTADLENDELLRQTPGVPWIHTDGVQARARRAYAPDNSFLDVTQGSGGILEPPTTDAQRAAVLAAWKALVFEHPVAFARHRLAVFGKQIELPIGHTGGFVTQFTGGPWEEVIHHRAMHSVVQRAWIRSLGAFGDLFGGSVRFYLALALALLPMCRRQRLAFVLLLSGIAHELGLLLVAPAIDHRYSHWMVVATIVGAIILFAARRKPPVGAVGMVSGVDLR